LSTCPTRAPNICASGRRAQTAGNGPGVGAVRPRSSDRRRPARTRIQKALDYLFRQEQDKFGPRGERLVYPAADVRLHAPRPNNARIACAGGNFADHAAAMAVKMRRRPYEGDAHQEIRKAGFWGFWKLAREIVGPDGELVYPDRCDRLDYEGEIAIVLGKRGIDLKPSQLDEYVWGVTILADWSIRAPRETSGGPLNFGLPKNFDTSCSLGPCIAVSEADPTNIDIETLVNGERRQRFNTRDMVPDGSSAPERFLRPGGLVEMSSPSIGSLRTRVVAKRR